MFENRNSSDFFTDATITEALERSKRLSLMKDEVKSIVGMITDVLETSFGTKDFQKEVLSNIILSERVCGTNYLGNSSTFSVEIFFVPAKTSRRGFKVMMHFSGESSDSINVRNVEYYHSAMKMILNLIGERFPHFKFAFGFYAPSLTERLT